MTDTLPVQTGKTVLELIEALIDLEEATLSELAAHLDMPKSTLHDHLQSFEAMGLVVSTDGRYRPSLRFLEIGERVRRQRAIYKSSHQQVKELATETGEHAGLMIEENGVGVLLYVARGENAVNLRAWAGQHLELSTNAPGKAILAHMHPERVDTIIDRHGLPQYTPKTITDRDVLKTELDEIRERGYATETGELVEGVRAVATPIISHEEIRGAIAVGGPHKRMRGKRFDDDLPDMLLQTANVVELNLSYG